MADQLPINFAIPGENIIATYDYNDIADGTGIVEFYLFSAFEGDYQVSGAEVFEIGKEAVFSHSIEVQVSDAKSFFTKEFNTPRTIKGTALLSFSMYKSTNPQQIKIQLFHYDGTTSTQIGSDFHYNFNDASSARRMINAKIDCPATHFKIGEQLKITIDGSGATNSVYIGIDPQNRDGTNLVPSTTPSITTQFIARIPFKIET